MELKLKIDIQLGINNSLKYFNIESYSNFSKIKFIIIFCIILELYLHIQI